MSSLLQVITGDSWNSELGRKMGEYNPWALLFIMAVLVFVGLGFLNLMSAVFVESLLEMSKNGAAHDRKKKKIIEEKAMENVAMLFAHIDTDGNGMLDENEARHHAHTTTFSPPSALLNPPPVGAMGSGEFIFGGFFVFHIISQE